MSSGTGATERAPRFAWHTAVLAERRPETRTAVTLGFEVPAWPGHRAGQHVDVRLTAEDGYQAQRSYSIASAPGAERLELTVERLDDGEVSPYLAGDMRPGDALELRGPIGGWFAWGPEDGGPLLLVGGGSGVVPLAAMLRAGAGSEVPARLLLSVRSLDAVYYREELAARGDDVRIALTRDPPPAWAGYARRVDAAMLAEVGWAPEAEPLAFVCGPTAFVEHVAELLVDAGHAPERVRTERFGPSS